MFCRRRFQKGEVVASKRALACTAFQVPAGTRFVITNRDLLFRDTYDVKSVHDGSLYLTEVSGKDLCHISSEGT